MKTRHALVVVVVVVVAFTGVACGDPVHPITNDKPFPSPASFGEGEGVGGDGEGEGVVGDGEGEGAVGVGVDGEGEGEGEGVVGVGGEGEGGDGDDALHVRFLGVMGFVVEHAGDVVLTAPLFTRANEATVSVGGDVPPDDDATDASLEAYGYGDMSNVRAIISGHAHYDHLMDVPHIMETQAPNATLYSNVSARHIFAGVAPDRDDTCTDEAPAQTIARERVVAVDDPLASTVDYNHCAAQRPDGAPLDGAWIHVPGSRIRLFPICSEHPDQVAFYHFAPGDVDDDQCVLPPAATSWKEGHTVAFLIDFLDDDDVPVFRVFYQDAPTNAPIGIPPSTVLADKRVDVALLCTGSYDQVDNEPEDLVAALQPRYAISGHWEDFFAPLDTSPRPIPFLDLDAYEGRADTVMASDAAGPAPTTSMTIDDVAATGRHALAQPGNAFVVAADE